jgi:hypothetical protein
MQVDAHSIPFWQISLTVLCRFLLATIYLGALDDKITRKQVKHTLTQFQGDIVATNEAKKREILDQAYGQAMEPIIDLMGDFRTLAMKALSWIAFAKESPTPLQLRHALAVEPGNTNFGKNDLPQLERIISVCAGLVTYDPATDDIRLVHYTTQEYFQATWQRWSPGLYDYLSVTLLTHLSFNSSGSDLSRRIDFFGLARILGILFCTSMLV